MPRFRKHFLKSKDITKLLVEVNGQIGMNIEDFFNSKIRVQINQTENGEIFVFNGKAILTRYHGKLFPTLFFNEAFSVIPKIVVDMGAVPYICKGADVMAPGVTAIKDEFKEHDIILVVDERHGKPIAVGTALFNSKEMSAINQGKVVNILHYVGDKLWNHLIAS